MRRPFLFVLAVLIPLLLYARTATFGYVHADDVDLIAGNQDFLANPANAPRAFARSYFEVEGELTSQKTYYRPLTIVSFMLDAARAGADPGAYHATNVVLHAAASGLVLALALAWGAAPWPAFAAGLVFAVHPVNVQAVAWIAGRNELLMAVFGLTSLLTFAAIGREREGVRGSGRSGQAAAVVHPMAFAGALFSKETGVVFPLVALLHHRLVARKPLSGLHTAVLAADAALAMVWIWLRARALAGMPPEPGADAWRTAGANAPQVLSVLRKMVFPVELNVAPGVHALDFALAAVALMLFAFVARRLPRGVGGLAAAWVLAFLLPALLVPGLPAYEHRAYLPLSGVLIACALGPRAAAPAKDPRGVPTGLVPLAIGLVAALFAAGAWQRQEVFRDAVAYWTDASRDPRFGPIADVNLGQLYEGAGRPADARRAYLRALDRDPDTPKAHNNLGVVLMGLDEPALARSHFEEEARRHPWNADAWFNLGILSEMQGDENSARRHYQRALAENPAYQPARDKLAQLGPG